MQPLLFNFNPSPLVAELAEWLGAEIGTLEQRRFPDGESYLRVLTPCRERSVVVCCDLQQPDNKLPALLFLAAALRDQGAARIGLASPYLPYMRQDKVFQTGEAVTSRYFARLISGHFDWLVTVDPHLHRYSSLDEIYDLPSRVVEAAPAMADWIRQHIEQPLLIGPDSESEQWVNRVAELAGAPSQILQKIRHGDYQVDISLPEVDKFITHSPVLIDDIISSGGTMLKTLQHLKALGLSRPTCIAVHGLFAGQSYARLCELADVVTCNTLSHVSNRVDLSQPISAAINELL